MAEHWTQIGETTSSAWKFRFMLWATIHLPQRVVEGLASVIVFFFCLGAAPVRKRSRSYLEHVWKSRNRRVSCLDVYRHILSFALSMVEKIWGWAGKISFSELEFRDDDVGELVERLNAGRGAFVLCSHLGNIEAMRALTGNGKNQVARNFRVFPVVDFSGTKRFNALLRKLNPGLMENCFDANSVGVETALFMREKLEAGDIVAIAGDRTSARTLDRSLAIPFLGETANFPEGAFMLAEILKYPVYFIFAFRKKDLDISSPYEFHVVRAKTELVGARGSKRDGMKRLACEYVSHLEKHCMEHPYQWYNFFDFWQKEN